MIRACTHEARGGRRDWKTETRRKTRVFVYFSRANAACVCSCARVYVYGLTFLSAEDRRASTRMAHRKSSTMRFARTAMRVARARAPISMILPPPFVRLCVPLFFFLQPVTSLNSRKSRIHFCPPRGRSTWSIEFRFGGIREREEKL